MQECSIRNNGMEKMNQGNFKKDIPEVTVLCIAYNHAPYIRDCLDGIVHQKVNFPFRAYVHDDASTDETARIILEYARRYPEIIIPLIEDENQFSQGVQTSRNMMDQIVWGKYIAVCEGDDYWIDSFKLQTQFDFMEEHPEYSLCLHNAIINDLYHKIDYLSEPPYRNCDKTCNQIISEGGGKLNPTASFFIRSEKEFPPIPHHCSASDHFELIKLASRGKVYWLSKPMSVYRWGLTGSWTDRQTKSDISYVEQHVQSRIDALRTYDKATSGNYHKAFQDRMRLEQGKLDIARQEEKLSGGSVRTIAFCTEIAMHDRIKYLLQKLLPASAYFFLKRRKNIQDKKQQGTLIAAANMKYKP